MASWPITLPNPSGVFTLSPQDQTVRTDMDGGNAKVRRRSRARNDNLATSWVMTDAQTTIFKDWFDSKIGTIYESTDTNIINGTDGINGGAEWFNVSLPLGSTIPTAVQARFKASYVIDHIGGTFWKVTGTLEIRN